MIKIARREIRYLFNSLRKPDVIEIEGIKIPLYMPGISCTMKKIFYRGNYEAPERRIIKTKLKCDDSVLEVGAGVGFLASLCCKSMKDPNRVFAYEANPFLTDILRETFKLNNVNPKLEIVSLSDKDGVMDFYIENDFYSSSVFRRTDKARIVQVETRNINSVLSAIKPTFLIVDIEGGEADLFRAIHFGNIQKICVELHPHIISKKRCDNILDKINKNNFILDKELSRSGVFYFEK